MAQGRTDLGRRGVGAAGEVAEDGEFGGGGHGNSLLIERSTTVATPAANSATLTMSDAEVTPLASPRAPAGNRCGSAPASAAKPYPIGRIRAIRHRPRHTEPQRPAP